MNSNFNRNNDISYEKNRYQYATPKIGVIGIGGAGTNIIDSVIKYGLTGAKYVVCNTDSQALNKSICENKVHLRSADRTSDYGAGGNPELGSKAATDSLKEIFAALGDIDMLFITAGAGGGTGSGAAPVIAKAAKSRGILTLGFVTRPFDFEGANRSRIADAALTKMQDNVDCLVVAKNQQLLNINKTANLKSAFDMINSVLYSGIAGIVNIINRPGMINVDFQDVLMVLKNRMNKVVFGVGVATGENAGRTAAELSLTNQLLEIDTDTLRQVDTALIAITGGENLSLNAVSDAVEFIRQQISSHNENIIVGMSIDENFDEDKVEVCVFASCPNVLEAPIEISEQKIKATDISRTDLGLEKATDISRTDLGLDHHLHTIDQIQSMDFAEQDHTHKLADELLEQMNIGDLEDDMELYVGRKHISLQENKDHYKNSELDGMKSKGAKKHDGLFSMLWRNKQQNV